MSGLSIDMFNLLNTGKALPHLAVTTTVGAAQKKIFSSLVSSLRDMIDLLTKVTHPTLLRVSFSTIVVSQKLLHTTVTTFCAHMKESTQLWTLNTGGVTGTTDQERAFTVLWQAYLTGLPEEEGKSCIPAFVANEAKPSEKRAKPAPDTNPAPNEDDRVAVWAAATVTAISLFQKGLVDRYCTAFVDTIARQCKVSSWKKLEGRFQATASAALRLPIFPAAGTEGLRTHVMMAAKLKMDGDAYALVIRYSAFGPAAEMLEKIWKEQFAESLDFSKEVTDFVDQQWLLMAKGLLESIDASLAYLETRIPSAFSVAKKGGPRINSLVTPAQPAQPTLAPQLAIHCPRCGGDHLLRGCSKSNVAIYAAPAECMKCNNGVHWKLDCPKG